MITHFKKPKKITRLSNIFSFILFGILILVIAGFLVSSNLKINKKRNELKFQISQLEKEIQFFKERNEQLKAGILERETQDYLEREIRERLNLRKPGEEVVVVLPPPETEEESLPAEKSFWGDWWQKIKNFW